MTGDPLFVDALQLLRMATGDPEAGFRDGQFEAIEAVVRRGDRLLLVQKTGWGKSIVYFITARISRRYNRGPCIIISPLLALMRDQIRQAGVFGLNADVWNSSNQYQHDEIVERWRADEIDVLFTTPEQLGREEFTNVFLGGTGPQVSLLVIDEVHCISDWGHDFRPDYQRIARVLQFLPRRVRVIATTATANDRVCEDVVDQLGDELRVLRGNLSRPGLRLQNIKMPGTEPRLAWLVENVPKMPGSGVIYTLTIRDAERVAEWMQSRSIDARAYHSRLGEDRCRLEEALLANEIKALVATSAYGMGVDKPDLHFVIHFQHPKSVIDYYQQVGRAGRAVSPAFGVMLCGEDDSDIVDHFIESAFPTPREIEGVLNVLEEADDGLTVREMERTINSTSGRIESVLKFLRAQSPTPVDRQDRRWFRTASKYVFDLQRAEQITDCRRREQRQMHEYIAHRDCLMQFIRGALQDPHNEACGECANCIGTHSLDKTPSEASVRAAEEYLQSRHGVIKPRESWIHSELALFSDQIRISPEHRAQEGRTLCIWGDGKWGQMVMRGKTSDGHFHDQLVEASVNLIRTKWRPDPRPEWVTCVPSLTHPELVPDFARRVAEAFGMPFVPCVSKLGHTQPQKTMQNSYQQLRNVRDAFDVRRQGDHFASPVLLIDDMVDSKWTMTVIAALLREAGSGAVFPYALAEMPLGGS